MKPNVLLVGQMMPHIMAALDAAYNVHRLYEAGDRDAFLGAVGGSIRGIATPGQADRPIMDACPNLEIISSFGVGYDGVDIGHAKSRGIIVCNTPGVLDDEVANTAISLLLATTRRIVAYDRYLRGGRWVAEGDPPLTRGLAGKTIGILGLGRIGTTIAQKLAVFHCDIVYHARNRRDDQPYRYFADLVEMAGASDAIIIITPGGAGTHHIINRAVLDALGPDGTLINVARGSVVDEEALVAALVEGRLGAAGLDVFANEPHVPEALMAMDNVVLLPHQGSATVETRRAMGDLVVDNLAAHFAGKPPLTPVV
jgi:lactate dehydrogenase-like 2-hydroxyacid dehydrogenase